MRLPFLSSASITASTAATAAPAARRAAARDAEWTAAFEATRSLPDGGHKTRIAMPDALPLGYALYENLSVGTIQPENRSMRRQPHLRFQVALEGKVIGEATALAVIAARLRKAEAQAA